MFEPARQELARQVVLTNNPNDLLALACRATEAEVQMGG